MIALVIALFLDFEDVSVLVLQEIEKEITLSNFISVSRNEIFCYIANVENYPNLPLAGAPSVKILNQSKNVIYAEETISGLGLSIPLLVKHDLQPYEKHVLTVHGGKADGTKITFTFEETDNGTKITSFLKLKLKGQLVIFGLLSKQILQSTFSKSLAAFEIDINSHQGKYSC